MEAKNREITGLKFKSNNLVTDESVIKNGIITRIFRTNSNFEISIETEQRDIVCRI